MTFVKGQSGNPGGRTKEYMEIRDLAQKHAPSAFKTLTKLSKEGKTEAVRVQASNSILDRAFGKPAQAHTGEGGTGPITASLSVKFVDERSTGDSDSE